MKIHTEGSEMELLRGPWATENASLPNIETEGRDSIWGWSVGKDINRQHLCIPGTVLPHKYFPTILTLSSKIFLQ